MHFRITNVCLFYFPKIMTIKYPKYCLNLDLITKMHRFIIQWIISTTSMIRNKRKNEWKLAESSRESTCGYQCQVHAVNMTVKQNVLNETRIYDGDFVHSFIAQLYWLYWIQHIRVLLCGTNKDKKSLNSKEVLLKKLFNQNICIYHQNW